MIGRLVTPGLYRAASRLAGPAIGLYLAHRRAHGKEDPVRYRERLGHHQLPRPEGALIWAHAASVGESLTLLPLIAALGTARPAARVLVTSGTVTSATLLAERLPAGAIHQYVPIDRPGPVRRFLAHWRPDVALWVESELWPNLVLETAARGVPMLLLNGRMSDRSAARWARYPELIHPLLAAFRAVLAQTEADAAHYRTLGATKIVVTGNLKYDALPLTYDEATLQALGSTLGERPLWLAASTHEGEEAAALDAHSTLATRWPDLLTLIAPRHPGRADEILRLATHRGVAVARRSRGEPIKSSTGIYLVDTLGELGLFYALARVVFVGGSLVPIGGHNALEPARLGCALIAGPNMANFAELQSTLRAANALITVRDATELAAAVGALLADPMHLATQAASARRVAATLGGALARTLDHLLPLVPASPVPPALSHARA